MGQVVLNSLSPLRNTSRALYTGTSAIVLPFVSFRHNASTQIVRITLSLLQKSPSIPTLSSDEDRDSDGASVPANNDERANGQGRLARDAVGGSQKSCHSQDPGQHGDQGATGVVANNPGQVLGKESAVSLAPLPKQQELFFTTTDFYLALRMHHLLAERLAAAKRLCREAESSRQTVVACPQQVRKHLTAQMLDFASHAWKYCHNVLDRIFQAHDGFRGYCSYALHPLYFFCCAPFGWKATEAHSDLLCSSRGVGVVRNLGIDTRLGCARDVIY